MAAERRPSPGKPAQGVLQGTSQFKDPGRLQTPVPRSREQATEDVLDARAMGTASMMSEEETGERPTAAPRSAEQLSPAVGFAASGRLDDGPTSHDSAAGPNSTRANSWSSYSPPPESFREAPTEPAGAPDVRPEDLVIEPQLSAGYYSVRPPRHSGIEIPRAPKLPSDLARVDEQTRTYPAARTRPRPSERAPSIPPNYQAPSDSSYPETIRTPPPDPDVPSERPRRRSSTPPPPMQEARTLAPPPPDLTGERRSSYPAPRLYFAPHVRIQANDWARTGALSLPGCSSPRHARALQRALLLALLHEPGWQAIPEGLRQRAGWLFCEGWESDSKGHALRELDDLATVLGLPAGGDSRRILKMALVGVLPESYSKRPSTRPPSSSR